MSYIRIDRYYICRTLNLPHPTLDYVRSKLTTPPLIPRSPISTDRSPIMAPHPHPTPYRSRMAPIIDASVSRAVLSSTSTRFYHFDFRAPERCAVVVWWYGVDSSWHDVKVLLTYLAGTFLFGVGRVGRMAWLGLLCLRYFITFFFYCRL